MKQINKSTIAKVLGLGVILTTPLIFMTSCSASTVGTPMQAKVMVNGKNIDEKDYVTSETVKSAIFVASHVAQPAIILNNNPFECNALLQSANTDATKAFYYFMTSSYFSGSGPFIESDYAIGLALQSIDVELTETDTLKKPGSAAVDSQPLHIPSVKMKYVFYNRYSKNTVDNIDTIKKDLNYWKDQDSFEDKTLAETYINNVQSSYTVTIPVNAEYNLKHESGNGDWTIASGSWNFTGATGSKVNSSISFDSNGINKFVDTLSKTAADSLTAKYNADEKWTKDKINDYKGMISTIA